MSKEYTGSSPSEATTPSTLLKKRSPSLAFLFIFSAMLAGCTESPEDELAACAKLVKEGLRPVADQREDRFMGKV